MLEKYVLKKMLGPMGEEVKRDYRKLHENELHALHFSPNTEWANSRYRVIIFFSLQVL